MAQQAGQLSPDGRWLWNGAEWVPNPSTVTQPPTQAGWWRPYESPRFRSNFVTIFLLVNVGSLLIGILVDVAGISTVAQGGAISGAQAIVTVILAVVFLILYLGSFVPAVVFFCMWVHRIVRNMPALGSPDPRWSPSGAVWRCFIPILSWFHPLLSTVDAWRGSDPRARHLDVGARKQLGQPIVFAGWWALWLIAGFISGISGRLSNSNDSGTVVIGFSIGVLSDLMLIGAAAFAIMVVRQVTQRQDYKNELIATGQLV